MNASSKKRIGIILPYLNDYRVPFLNSLKMELSSDDIDLSVAAGVPIGADVAREDSSSGFPTVAMRTVTRNTPLGSIQYRWPPRSILRSDAIIVEHAVKNLDSHLLLMRPRKSRVAVWGHGHTITKTQSDYERLAQKLMIRRADWYFGYTAGSIDRACSLGMPRERSTEVRNTIDTHRLRIERLNNPRDEDVSKHWIALYVGGLDDSKRIGFLLESARRIFDLDSRFRLHIVGNGNDRQSVELAAQEPWCEYLGSFPLAEDFSQVRNAQVLLMPGRVGLAAVDSFAIEAPIVTTKWPWHAPEFEYLDTSNSVVTEDLMDDYVESVVDLMSNPLRLENLQQGCKSSSAEFSVDDMAKRYARGCRLMLDANRRMPL